jgi:hypothetical protein
MKKNNNFKLNYYNLNMESKDIRLLLIIIIILVIILTFRKILGIIFEKFIVFSILFLLFLCLSKNIFITLISSSFLFLFINLIMNYRNTIEKFEDIKNEAFKPEDMVINKNIFETTEVKDAAKGLTDLINKMNGGIELKEDDLKETGVINIDTDKYKDENTNSPLKKAQMETYQLIDTVNTLKDTITTLAPVLSEGKKLIDIFHNLKL